MPVYQNKKTKLWEYRAYAYDIYGNRKQFEKGGFRTKKEALESERYLQSLDKVSKEYNITFQGDRQVIVVLRNAECLRNRRAVFVKTTLLFHN